MAPLTINFYCRHHIVNQTGLYHDGISFNIVFVLLLEPGLPHRQFGLVYWGLMPQQQPGSYQGGEMMMMKSGIWWRKPEYPEETTDLRQVTDETFHTYGQYS